MSKPSPTQIVEDLRARADQIERDLRNNYAYPDQAAEDAAVADCAEIVTLRAAADFIEKTVGHCEIVRNQPTDKTEAFDVARGTGYKNTDALRFAHGAQWLARRLLDGL